MGLHDNAKRALRALRLAGDLLRQVPNSDAVSADLREQARTILRHYPSAGDIDMVVQRTAEQDSGFGLCLDPEK